MGEGKLLTTKKELCRRALSQRDKLVLLTMDMGKELNDSVIMQNGFEMIEVKSDLELEI